MSRTAAEWTATVLSILVEIQSKERIAFGTFLFIPAFSSLRKEEELKKENNTILHCFSM
jgi:hypothetical protein